MLSKYRLILAFGSNQGDRAANFTIALNYLYEADPSFKILKQSAFAITRPFKSDDHVTSHHEHYLNFVCDIVTSHHPFYFYQYIIVPIEDRLGHSRLKKWEPRALDIDVLLAALNDKINFHDCTPLLIEHESFLVPHKGLRDAERISIIMMLKNELNLTQECIECHFQPILIEKN